MLLTCLSLAWVFTSYLACLHAVLSTHSPTGTGLIFLNVSLVTLFLAENT